MDGVGAVVEEPSDLAGSVMGQIINRVQKKVREASTLSHIECVSVWMPHPH